MHAGAGARTTVSGTDATDLANSPADMKSNEGDSVPTPDAAQPPAGAAEPAAPPQSPQPVLPREIGGREGPEPTRFGDWEKAGRCIDF